MMSRNPGRVNPQGNGDSRYNERMEMLEHRLSLRLAHYWHLHQHLLPNENAFECSVQDLFEHIEFRPGQINPTRTQSRLEHALARLKEDCVIGSYSIEARGDSGTIQDVAQHIAERTPGWWSLYMAQTVRILPHQAVQV